MSGAGDSRAEGAPSSERGARATQPLFEEYLARVRRVEELPANRSGSDKSWVHRIVRWTEAHHARARRK